MRFSGSLKENRLFRRIYSRGDSSVNSFLVLYCRKNGTRQNRLGLTVSAKMGCAVRRNRLRRRLREIYRLNEGRFKPGWDLVVVVRSRAVDAPYKKLEGAYLSLAEKLELLRKEEPSHETDPSGLY